MGQRNVNDKCNEITTVPELLRALELGGCIITADALLCQKNIAKEIIEVDADYVLALKGNQGRAFAEIKSFLDNPVRRSDKSLVFKQTIDKGHGRIETRRDWQSQDIGRYADKTQWEGLRSAGLVESMREIGGKQTMQRRYYLSGGASAWRNWRGRCAATGRLRTNSTGYWTWSLEKPKAERHGPDSGKSGRDTATGSEHSPAGQKVPAQRQRQPHARRHLFRLPQTPPYNLRCVSPALIFSPFCPFPALPPATWQS